MANATSTANCLTYNKDAQVEHTSTAPTKPFQKHNPVEIHALALPKILSDHARARASTRFAKQLSNIRNQQGGYRNKSLKPTHVLKLFFGPP